MRFMEAIRRKGHWFLIIFLVFFTITLFYGLTGGFDVSDMGGAGGNAADRQRIESPVLTKDAGEDTALLVDGRKVSNDVLNQVVRQMIERGMRSSDDPKMRLQAYGYSATMLVHQEVLLAYGEEKGIKLTSEDWSKAKSEAAASFRDASEEKKSGNVLGDAFGKLGDLRAQKAAFEKYLQTQGLSESQWEADAQRSLYTTKVRDEITKEINDAKKAENDKKKAEVDKALAAGKNFAEVAKEHSEGPQKDSGGDVDWIGRGLLEPDVTEKVFAVAKGKTSDWIETPAWHKKFLIVDKVEATGPEFEKKKPELIKQIRDQKKDQAYEPSAEEIRDLYEKVQARVIDLAVGDDAKAQQRIQEMVDAAQVEFNNPYILAYQALMDYRLQPVKSVTREQLITIAKLAPLGADYDFSVLDKKLAAGKPKAAKAPKTTDASKTGAELAEDAAEGADAADTELPDTSGAAQMTDSVSESADTASEEDKERDSTPIYALAAGLIEKSIQDSNEASGNDWPYFMQAKIYYEWMKDDAQLSKQPIDTKGVREKLEALLAKVVESNNYSSMAHAMRGLNLARLEKKQEAEESLAQAEKYAPTEMGEVWDTIREGYKVLDNSAKLAEVDKKIQDMQQAQFQQMIQQQLQQQGGEASSGTIPIQIQ